MTHQGPVEQASSTPARSRGAHRSAAVAFVVVLLAVSVGVPLLISANYHALGIPRSDDWSYLVTLFRFLDSGRLSFNHWVSMSLVGQLLVAAPLAAITNHSISAVQSLTAIIGFFGLGCVAMAGARATANRWMGALLAITIAVGPMWGPLAVSFMTDVPAFAVSAGALLLAVIALGRRPVPLPWLAASAIVGFGAFTIRQYAIVAVAAVLIVGVWWFMSVDDRARAGRVVAIGAALIVAAVVFIAWWQTIPDGRSLTPTLPGGHALRVTALKGAGFLRLTGLLLIPIVAVAGPGTLLRRSWRESPTLTVLIGAATSLWLAGSALRVSTDLFVGNYVMPDGVLSDIVVIGRRPDVFPRSVWYAIVVVGSLSAIVIAAATVPAILAMTRRIRARDWRIADPVGTYLTLTAAGYATTYVFAMATGLQVYDRYVLPVLPAVGLLLLRTRGTRAAIVLGRPARGPDARAVGALVAVGALAVVGFAFTADSASFDGARWRAAEAATRAGWAPLQVNGGFEWLNYHRRDKPEPASTAAATLSSADRSGRAPICVTVHINPVNLQAEVIAVVVSRAPTRENARLVAFRTRVGCRPQGRRG